MTSTVVSAHLDALASAHPTFCARSGAADWTPGRAGGTSGYVKIAATTANSPPARWAVLLTGGVHAREWAPPDALVSFLEKLATAYAATGPITYPSWTDPVNGIVYDSFTIPWPWVRSVVEKLDLYVAPVVNPDGRDFSVAALAPGTSQADQKFRKEWRKNRRPAPAGNADPRAVGVDINRNFDVLWDVNRFFDVAAADVQSSTDPLTEIYRGDAAESEPETQNVARLMRSKGISFFIDFHAFSRDVQFSWSWDTNQSTDATKTFTNPAWDHRRDGPNNAGYAEYLPAADDSAQQAMAQRISDQVFAKAGGSDPRAQARSRYAVRNSSESAATSGDSQGYCLSRWFTAANSGSPIRPVMSFTVEVGGNMQDPDHDEGGFTPDYVNHYPKLEREIHVAAWAFLSAVAATGVRPAMAPPPPSPSGSGTSTCLMVALFAGTAINSDVLFLRDVRDRQLRAGVGGPMFATALVRAYGRIGPVLAARLAPHPRVMHALRDGLLIPLVAALRVTSARLGRWPRLRAQALAVLITLWSVVFAAAVAVAAAAVRLTRRRRSEGAPR